MSEARGQLHGEAARRRGRIAEPRPVLDTRRETPRPRGDGGGALLDVLLILSLAVWIVGLVSQGAIGMGLAAVALLFLVFAVAALRSAGQLLRVLFPIASLAIFLIWAGRGDTQAMKELAGPLALLFVIIVGVYVMVRVGSPRR